MALSLKSSHFGYLVMKVSSARYKVFNIHFSDRNRASNEFSSSNSISNIISCNMSISVNQLSFVSSSVSYGSISLTNSTSWPIHFKLNSLITSLIDYIIAKIKDDFLL